ncbi:hypothetical protein Kpol_1048p15 [Vanderwaltozyma polyspora DSM 70294]|uniref:Major facilitator superfamily (MFS) profile domain-containing protein n=1 Tax=Vanderwaltozyma polyspora (strain ATCC 22028 / DSM 70294 / BCRC 21397 / CBS 2163 / NBRC 10782 / NRRL Y-8283 / UCD 57-17) TaxID=436907 RepID=A7TGH8_VANPO|nr:uncharacterized protein Kpol_1048p15 [Vanderwaltozyma polyspora DSM 70294]EDO18585.1 hypothetical protein Kpol_1048p15 [Vanderwaltozyma polyspora DSM 70294]
MSETNSSQDQVSSIVSSVISSIDQENAIGIHEKTLNSEDSNHILAPQSRLSLGLSRTASHIERTISNAVHGILVKGGPSEDTGAIDDNTANEYLISQFNVGDAFRLIDSRNAASQLPSHSDEESNIYEPSITSYRTKLNHDDQSSSFDNGITRRITENQDYDGDDDDGVSIVQKVFTNHSTGKVELPPDGGYGWVSVFCVTLIMFSTWGCNSSFGIFLSFYLSNGTFPNATRYDYALIGGLTVFLAQLLSPFVMILMRTIGYKVTMLFGTALMFSGFLLASYATKLWHLYITQGFLIGVSICLIFIPATTVIPGWFLKRRAVAMGFSLMGTGLGGVVYGLATNKLIQDTGGTEWALRFLAISTTSTVLLAISLIKQRNPQKAIGIRSWKKIQNEFKTMFSLRVIKKPFVPLVSIWFTAAIFGYNLMVFTLASYAVARGLSQHDGSTLTAILNGSQTVGRPVIGLLGDRFGRMNITIILNIFLIIFMFGFWIPAHTFLQLIFFSICLGSCVGVANVMNTVLIADMTAPADFLPAWAFVNYSGSGFFLVVEVIAQALVIKGSNPYIHTQIFAGFCFVLALLVMFILREYGVRKNLNEKYKYSKKMDSDLDLKEESDTKSGKVDSETVISATTRPTLEKEERLLEPSIKNYFLRAIYPIKV